MSQVFAFQSTTFDVIDRNAQPWIQSRQLATALGYKDESSVRRIYERNKDEFTVDMTATVKLTVGITPVEVRIFSPRGCYAVAMFARTSVAKAFRVWVLDVLEALDKTKQPPFPPSLSRLSTARDPERKELTAVINGWVSVAPIHYAGARSIVNAHFSVKSVDDMTLDQVKAAIQYVQQKIAEATKPMPKALPEVSVDRQLIVKRRELRDSMYKTGVLLRDIESIVFSRPDRTAASHAAIKSALYAIKTMDSLADVVYYSVDTLHEVEKVQ